MPDSGGQEKAGLKRLIGIPNLLGWAFGVTGEGGIKPGVWYVSDGHGNLVEEE